MRVFCQGRIPAILQTTICKQRNVRSYVVARGYLYRGVLHNLSYRLRYFVWASITAWEPRYALRTCYERTMANLL